MITMLLGGLWHSAAWNYVVWGAARCRALRQRLWHELCPHLPVPTQVHSGWRVAAVVLTQLWVMLASVFLRRDSAAQANVGLRRSSVCGLIRA